MILPYLSGESEGSNWTSFGSIKRWFNEGSWIWFFTIKEFPRATPIQIARKNRGFKSNGLKNHLEIEKEDHLLNLNLHDFGFKIQFSGVYVLGWETPGCQLGNEGLMFKGTTLNFSWVWLVNLYSQRVFCVCQKQGLAEMSCAYQRNICAKKNRKDEIVK